MSKKKQKVIKENRGVPKKTVIELQESRDGGQIALRGYSYQFLYSCYLILSTKDKDSEFNLEGIEDIDSITYENEIKSITHIQLKYSTIKQDASFMSSVLKKFLEVYLLDKNRSFKLVYDFSVAKGHLSKLFQGNLDAVSRRYWQEVIEKIKKEASFWNWECYDFDDFISKILFENIKKDSLGESVECELIANYDITTDNINLFANGIKMLCFEKMEQRGNITLEEIRNCIEAIKEDISKGPQNPAHRWIRKVDFTLSTDSSTDYYEGKKATPADIVRNLPVSRPMLEKEIIDSVQSNMITVVKSSSGQGKTTLALKTQFSLQSEYVPYQIICCNNVQEIAFIVEYFKSRMRLGEKPLILLDNLDAHIREWNALVQLMQSELTYNYRILITSRENDWYNYAGDISNLHSLNIVKPILSEDEAKSIFNILQKNGYLHSTIVDWRKSWSMIEEKKLLIEYVYLLTHGEMIEERISKQMQEIGASNTGGIKFEILRQVCFADICGIKVSVVKLAREMSIKTGYDVGELIKSMVNEFLVQVCNDGEYVEGLHPVRSQHIVTRLHEFYPLDETAFAVTKIAEIKDFSVLFSHYPEYEFDKEKLYSNIVNYWWNPENLECFVHMIRGVFSGSVMQYYRENRDVFDDANEHGGLFLLATSLCPFIEFQEIEESMDTLEKMLEMFPDNLNVQYLVQLRDSVSKIDISQTDIFILSTKLYKKMKDMPTINIIDLNSYAIIADWLYNVDSSMNLATNIDLENLWNRSEEYTLDTISSLMYTSFSGNKEGYNNFIEVNLQQILRYLKHKTLSHVLYVDENRGVHVEYVIRLSEIRERNDESVSRLKYICKTLPIFEIYYSDAIMPELEMLEIYKIPDDAHKEIPIRNLIIMFRQEFTSLWLKTIQSNYEFDSVIEWLDHWFSARVCVCDILDKLCSYMYKILEGKNASSIGEDIDRKIAQYDKYLIEINAYPKENRPFDKASDLPSGFSKVKNEYFTSIQNFLGQFVSLIRKEKKGVNLALYNIQQAMASMYQMQSFFSELPLDDGFKNKHVFLCQQEFIKLNEVYMCCCYYLEHLMNKKFNKYHVKLWYTSVQNAKLKQVNEPLKQIQHIYNIEFPVRTYDEGIFSCYPIVLKEFDFTNDEMVQDFIINVASISQFPYDYLILMCCNEEENIIPKALRFSKRFFETAHSTLCLQEEKEIDVLSSPYPVDVTENMLECFDTEFKIQSEEINPNYRYIGDVAEELWIYSKNRELLHANEDRLYRDYMFSLLKENIDTMLHKIKEKINVEIYEELNSLCSSVYDGADFENEQLNDFMLRCQSLSNRLD